jgi:GTP-binding protein
MITDEITIDVKAGDGGDGKVSYRREKYIAKGGPDGGNGGQGGDVYFVGVSDLTALGVFRSHHLVEATKGQNGGSKNKSGKDAPPVYARIPVGTTITDVARNHTWEMTKVDQTILIARGGYGGRGNFELRSAQNKTPTEAEKGQKGYARKVLLNLQFIADIGLIGLPNAGKSSLLNELTQAHSKVGNYAFTTLEANLGSMDGIIIADIPGLIEGASTGKGLGDRFLKHIAKTKFLIHCIDATSQDVTGDYKVVRLELEKYDKKLLEKPELVLLTKSDMMSISAVQKQKDLITKINKDVMTISVLDEKSIESLKRYLSKI